MALSKGGTLAPPDAGDGCNDLWCPPPPDEGCDGRCPEMPPDAGPLADAGTYDAGTGEVEVVSQVFGARGLYTSPSFLTAAPKGAAVVADNLVVDVPGEYTTRRGFERLPFGYPVDEEVSSWTVYDGALVVHFSGGTLARYLNGAWDTYEGDYYAPSPGNEPDGSAIPGKVRFFQSQQALYFTTSQGMYRLEGATGTPAPAGVVQALPGVATVSAAGQALSTSSTTAYRYVWGRRAANGRVHLGAPSGRVVVVNRSESFTFSPTGMYRTGTGSVVLDVTEGVARSVVVGQLLTLNTSSDPANFPTGVKVIEAVGATSIQYNEAGAAVTAASPGGMSFSTTATAVRITHYIPFPIGVDDTYFLQVYRADEKPNNTDPSDEMYLVYEKAVADMAENAVAHVFTDNTPDDLKADALYTNANSGGSINAPNYPPPKAVETAIFDNRIIFANVELPERATMTLLSVGGPTGLNSGQGLKFTFEDGTSEEYTGDTDPENADSDTFTIFTDGSPSQNIANTTRSLVKTVSARVGGKLYARYLSTPGSFPGIAMFESREESEGAISVEAIQRGDMWSPPVRAVQRVAPNQMGRGAGVVTVFPSGMVAGVGHGYSVGQVVELLPPENPMDAARFPPGPKVITDVPTIDSFRYVEAGPSENSVGTNFFRSTPPDVQTDDEASPGGFMISPVANPDAVTATIPEIVGDRYKRILKVLPFGESVFFLKEDGLYRLTGNDDTSLAVEAVDTTIRFVAPRASWVMNGRAYALTTQGLATWTENGSPEPAAIQIESDLRRIVETLPDEVEDFAFAVAHESKRRAYLWLPTVAGDASATQAYVYNATADAWTRWPKYATEALVHPTEDRLYYAAPLDPMSGIAPPPAFERNTGTNADYVDEGGEPIAATLQWTPHFAPDANAMAQLVRSTYHFAGTAPTRLDVTFGTDIGGWGETFTIDATSSQSPGTFQTPPTLEQSRGRYHMLRVSHFWPNEPLRILGTSLQVRYHPSTTP